MKVHVLTGPKHEIAESVAKFEGEIREVIVFVDEPTNGAAAEKEDIFAEMEPFLASAGDVDYARESIYTQQPGE